MKIELTVEKEYRRRSCCERFVIDINDLGEARIRRRCDAPIERDEIAGMSLSDGHGGHIHLTLKVEAKP